MVSDEKEYGREEPGLSLEQAEETAAPSGDKPVYRTGTRYAGERPAEKKIGPLSRKALIGIVAAVVVVAAVLVCLLALYLNRQLPIEGSWKMEQDDGSVYLTIYEDNTAVVTADGYQVTGLLERKEGDILSFAISMKEKEVLAGEYRYRCTGGRLTLTRDNEEEAAGLVFSHVEGDVTQVAPPEDKKINPALVGIWEDGEGKIRYTFRDNGTMRTDLLSLGVSVNGIYRAEEGVLSLSKPVDGEMQTEKPPYFFNEQGNLVIEKMIFIKQSRDPGPEETPGSGTPEE